jgi:hypothetical protein
MYKSDPSTFSEAELCVFEDTVIDYTRKHPSKEKKPRANKTGRKQGPARRTRKKGRQS